MAQLVGILLVAAVAVVALKVAMLAALLVGIVFRTKATLSLIVVLGALALLQNYPAICYTLIGVAVIAALMKSRDEPA